MNPPPEPANELQRALLGIWARALGVEGIGPNDSFLALGGHSLIAIEMAAEVSALTGVEVHVADLMANPTVAEMSAAIARVIADGLGPETIERLGREPEPRDEDR